MPGEPTPYWGPGGKKEKKAMEDGKGKMTRRHERSRPEQGRICWCGNPSCPGGQMAGSGGERPSSGSVYVVDGVEVVPASGYDNMREAMMGVVFSQLGNSSRRISGFTDAATSGPPPAYTAARKKVETYLLKAGRDSDWEDVIGQEEAQATLREALEEPILRRELYEHYGMKPPRGVLLSGPPGCGKTLLARSAASAMARLHGADCEFLVLNGPSVVSPYVGVTEEIIRDIFTFAREYKKHRGHPLIVFMDEAEVLLPDRNGRTRSVAPWEESQVATFLAEMDGLEDCGAFVILATNRPEAIDEALLRDGRCDRKIRVGRPTREAAEVIVRRTMKGVPATDPTEMLVVAAVESFYSPHRVLQEGALIVGHVENGKMRVDSQEPVNMLLEHVVSGAMLTGIAPRAKSRAFRRDRAAGTVTGVSVRDVIDAVGEIYEENRGLEHSYAVREMQESFERQAGSGRRATRPPSSSLN